MRIQVHYRDGIVIQLTEPIAIPTKDVLLATSLEFTNAATLRELLQSIHQFDYANNTFLRSGIIGFKKVAREDWQATVFITTN